MKGVYDKGKKDERNGAVRKSPRERERKGWKGTETEKVRECEKKDGPCATKRNVQLSQLKKSLPPPIQSPYGNGVLM